MFTRFLLIASILVLAGCGTLSRQDVQIQPKEVVRIGVPLELTEPCRPSPPISPENYMRLLPHEREQHLTDYVISLFGTISECNSRLNQIRKLAPSR